MSGRTFTYQGNYDDFVRYLLPDVEMSDRRKSVGIGDSMLREVEEFLNRFVVTAVNDAGDIIFDAAGTYTFQGDVIIDKSLTAGTNAWHVDADGNMWWGSASAYTGADNYITAAGVLRFGEPSGTYMQTFVGTDRFGLEFFPSNTTDFPYEGEIAVYGTNLGVGAEQWRIGVSSPQGATNTDSAALDLYTESQDGSTASAKATLFVSSGFTTNGLEVTASETKLTSHGHIVLSTTSGNYVGIGTSSPQTSLHVTRSANSEVLRLQNNNSQDQGPYISLWDLDSRVGYVGFPNNDDLYLKNETSSGLIYFATNDLTRMAIEAGGQVGIGTSTPSAQLHVSAGTVNNVATFESTDAGALISLVDPSTTGSSYVGLRADGDELSLRAGNSNRVRIQADGDVGIGTTSPSYKLDVEGDSHFNDRMIIRAAGSDILTLEDSGGTNEGGYINFANSAGTSLGYIGYGNNDDIHIKNDDSGGNIYVGVAARWALQINTSGHLLPYADNFHNLGQSGRAWNTFYLHQGNQFSSGGYWTLRSRDSDRQVMELVSSERFKRDIVDMPTEEAYQVLDARVIKYRGIDDEDDVPLEAGLSAESLHNAGYEYAVRYDEGHWGETPRSIYYEYLTVPLIKICQDQRDRIESLETRLAALEA